MFSDLPLGGRRLVGEAASLRPLASEFSGLRMPGSSANVTTASATRITAAATVQPTSRRVLPRICAAGAPLRLRLRNLTSAYSRPPSTSAKITRAITSVILNRPSIWLALGEPPDCGVKNASVEARWPKAAEILFTRGLNRLDDVCH